MPLLLALAICCFAAGAVVRCLDPLVPELARAFGSDPTTIALAASAFALPYAISQPVLGPLSDAVGKARVVKGCLAVLCVAMVLTALVPDLNSLFALRVLAGAFAGGIAPLCYAIVGDRFDISERQVALSRLVMALLTGMLTGAAATGFIADAFGWRAGIGFSAAVTLAATAAAFASLEPRPAAERGPFSLASIGSSYRIVLANPRAKICFAAVFVGGMCMFGVLPHIASLLEANKAGSVREAGFVIAGMAIGGVAYGLSVRRILAALGGQLNMIRAGGFIAAAGFLPCALPLSWPQMAAAFVVLGLGFYMIHNSLQTQATELAPDARGSALSMHALSFFMGQAAGAPLYGIGFNHLGAAATFLIAAGLMAALGLMLASLLTRAAASNS